MSDLWLNVRIWMYHFQAGDQEWWRVMVRKNKVHRKNKRIFQIHELDWPKSYIGGRKETATIYRIKP